jgi:hemoglobin/transferrin/lactoferrin receptor protein
VLSAGLRGTITSVQATFNQKFFNTDQKDLNQQTQNISYHAGITGKITDFLFVNALTSSGFRNPNIDDASKLFEQTNGFISVPNINLQPERIFNHELGLTFTHKEIISVEVQGFYSKLLDAIVTRPTIVNGQSTVLFNGQLLKAQSQQNIATAEVYGIQTSIKYQMNDSFSFQTNLTYTRGTNFTNNVPLDHIPPVYGSFWANYKKNRFLGNVYVIWNGWKNLSDYSNSGEDNLQYATPYGMPEWYTLNLKTSYKLSESKNYTIQLGVENILDMNYRTFSSGINGAGRNFIVAIRAGF